MPMTIDEKRSRRLERKAAADRLAQCHADALQHVERGTCPRCGRRLFRNSALAGWWQCGAYASAGFRHAEYANDPNRCSWQCFTE
jgi:hypothetical protein